ncbi:hypothetical protein [Roseateles sp.]|uniref:hypothetical protein n=1 Tax=Roseateles sp. TaxID=1971397 RepID=UPI0031E10F49
MAFLRAAAATAAGSCLQIRLSLHVARSPRWSKAAMLVALAGSLGVQIAAPARATSITPLVPLAQMQQEHWQLDLRPAPAEPDQALQLRSLPPLIHRLPGLSGRPHKLASMPDTSLPPLGRVPADTFAAALRCGAQAPRPEFQLALKTQIGGSQLAVSPASKGLRFRLTRWF